MISNEVYMEIDVSRRRGGVWMDIASLFDNRTLFWPSGRETRMEWVGFRSRPSPWREC